MPEYEYRFEMFDTEERVEIPDDAIGVTVDSYSDHATVRYLVPVGSDD